MSSSPRTFIGAAPRHPISQWLLPAMLLGLVACDSSSNSGRVEVGIAPEPVVGAGDALPGVVITMERVRGGTGPGGKARPGDRLSIDFRVTTDGNQPLELSTMARGAAMVSGPTFNYQRVIASQTDVLTRATKRALGAYTYTFTVPLPATYLPPLNDTTAITEGELTGQNLLSGTYTIGLELRKDYTVGSEVLRDPGNASIDFLLGDASAIERREVVTLANCNQCHVELRAHGDNRNELTNCLLCHTTGAEDGNLLSSGGGTPGVAIDFKVLIHKIHAGKHLPSVNGVATNSDGSRNYAATPTPYIVQGRGGALTDYSKIAFPVWPSLLTPMPRDTGFGALTSGQQALENTMRSGPVDCDKCHGDPDGDGPLPAPAQGELAYVQPSRSACASCHDDWDPELPYTANGATMPGGLDNSTCRLCHRESGTPLDVRDAHLHPLRDASRTPGLHFDVSAITDVGNGNGRFETGEKVQLTLRIRNDANADVPATALSTINAVINGPTGNPNLVHYVRIYASGMGSGPEYTFFLPQLVYYESVGNSNNTLQNFATARAPHRAVANTPMTLLRVTGTTAATTLALPAPALQNYIDVANGTGASFATGAYILIDDANPGIREFLRVQRVEGDRLWFSSLYSPNYAPGLRVAHAAGASVQRLSTAAVPSSSYNLDTTNGTFVETTEFGDGELLASYTTDFVVPEHYPGAFNESPALGEDWGKWTGLPLLSGTYQVGIWGARQFTVSVGDSTTTYTEGSQPSVHPVLFGTATEVEVIDRIDDVQGCYRCHEDIQFHGGSRRGYDTCALCHTLAGAEDAATYIYPSGEASPGVTIDFRTMLHKIHHGKQLDAGASYRVAGFGGTGHSYENVGFPVMPGGTQQCAVCHGNDNTAWVTPAPRNHPQAAAPTRTWRATCGSCHDSSAAQAHIEVTTSASGAESCAICHGNGRDHAVRDVHRVR
jgi:OmcA/MtrC family decaheme c-type cytochrome